MRTWQIISIAVIATGAMLYAQERRQRNAEERTRAEIVALGNSIHELRRTNGSAGEASGRARTEATARASVAEAGAAPHAPAGVDGDVGERPPKSRSPSTREVAERTELTFSQQKADQTWAPSAEAHVTAELRKVLDDPSVLRAVECRETLCRLEAQLGSEAEYGKFFEKMLDVPWQGESVLRHSADANGRVVATGYLARPGHSLRDSAANSE